MEPYQLSHDVNPDVRISIFASVARWMRQSAGIFALLAVGIGVGLFLERVSWPLLRESPQLRLVAAGLVIASLLLISVLCAYDRDKTVQAARSAGMMVFLLITGLSLVYVSSVVPDDVRIAILRGFILVFFAALPGWLYLQFMWSERTTLWSEYVSNLYRLHIDEYGCLPEPPQESCFHRLWSQADGDAPSDGAPRGGLYREKFEAVYGPLTTRRYVFAGVLNVRTFLPVAIATVLIAAGWMYVFLVPPGGTTAPSKQASTTQPATAAQPADVAESAKAGPSAADAGQPEKASEPAKGGPSVHPAQPAKTVVSLDAKVLGHRAFEFGFLGSYFFVLQSLVRRYFQRDLKPDAYINATSRIIIVALLVWVITHAAFAIPSTTIGADGQPGVTDHTSLAYLPVLAFAIGVFPVIGWRIIENLVKRAFRGVVPTLDEHFALSKLEGLNAWHESRLMEEGIDNMQNLATINLVDAMLNTRVPMNRLVDWVDQSLLYLHFGEDEETIPAVLRRLGVRAATDIEDLMESSARTDALLLALNGGNVNGPNTLECIHASLRDEPNFFHVQEWKSFPRTMLEGSEGLRGSLNRRPAPAARTLTGASTQSQLTGTAPQATTTPADPDAGREVDG